MAVKVAINGFGRIGCLAFRQLDPSQVSSKNSGEFHGAVLVSVVGHGYGTESAVHYIAILFGPSKRSERTARRYPHKRNGARRVSHV